MKELKFISRYVRRHGLAYILGIMALFAVDLMNALIPRYTGEITDGLEAQTINMDQIWTDHPYPDSWSYHCRGTLFLAFFYFWFIPFH